MGEGEFPGPAGASWRNAHGMYRGLLLLSFSLFDIIFAEALFFVCVCTRKRKGVTRCVKKKASSMRADVVCASERIIISRERERVRGLRGASFVRSDKVRG